MNPDLAKYGLLAIGLICVTVLAALGVLPAAVVVSALSAVAGNMAPGLLTPKKDPAP